MNAWAATIPRPQEAATEEQAAAKDDDSPVSTGSPEIDRRLDQLDWATQAMVHTLLSTSGYSDLADKVQARLWHGLQAVETPTAIEKAFQGDPELRAEWGFWTGLRCGAAFARGEQVSP